MLGNLIASVIISCGVACSTPRIDKPQYAQQNNIQGTYVLKYIDESQRYYHTLDIDFTEINFLTIAYGNNVVYLNDVDTEANSYDTYVSANIFTLTFAPDTQACHLSFMTNGFDLYDYLIESDDYFSDFGSTYANLDLEYFSFVMTGVCYLTDDQLTLFNTFFTKDLNPHFIRYQGWYTFNNNVNTVSAGNFSIVASMSFDNNLYQYTYGIIRGTSNDLKFFNYGLETGYRSAIDNGTWQTSARQVYLNTCVLSQTSYTILSHIGVFDYVDTTTPYDLSDLFFDIGDTPVVFITGLFDFELFGVNFAVAFMGVITLMIMVFLIRKVM